MKKLALLLALSFIFASFSYSEEVNLENLKEAHIKAMTANGHATLVSDRNSKMIFLNCGKNIASACFGETLGTAYMERGDIKVYWSVEKIEGGILVTMKITIKDVVYTRSFKILFREGELKVADLGYGKEDASRFSVDWSCLLQKAPGCITCATNWVCWLGCVGAAAWDCVKW